MTIGFTVATAVCCTGAVGAVTALPAVDGGVEVENLRNLPCALVPPIIIRLSIVRKYNFFFAVAAESTHLTNLELMKIFV